MDQLPSNTSPEIEELLNFVAERRASIADQVIKPCLPAPYIGADRWLLASLVQKALRRGDLQTARRAGHQLLHVDPTRLWRRLMVVGLEDIGIGDPTAATLLIAIAGLPQARSLFARPVAALDAALKLGCEARKERSGDAFGSIVLEMQKDVSHSLEALSQSGKIAVLSYGHLPWRRRLRSAFLLGRDWVPAVDRKAQFVEIAEVFEAAGVPGSLLAACMLYRGKADDLLPLYVPLIYSLWLAQGSPSTTQTNILGADCVGPIPSYGFDPLHTRLGRRAIDVWLKSYLTAPPFTASQVAIALWNLESASSAQLLTWPIGDEIKEQGGAADLMNRGLLPTRHPEVTAWVNQQMPILQHARAVVWQSAQAWSANPLQSLIEQKDNSHDG